MKSEEYYKEFCKKFKAFCLKSNLSLMDVSEATEINQWELLAIAKEVPAESVSLKTFLTICEFINISPSDISV